MADVTIDGAILDATARGLRSVAFKRLDAQVGYKFFIPADGDFSYRKTTDGGATWGAAVQIGPDSSDMAYDVWPDWYTPGDTGTLIHLWWFGSTTAEVLYRTLDTATDALGTQRVVFDGVSAATSRGVFVSGTKTRTGHLYCAYDIDAGAEKGLHNSTDLGATWSASLDATFVEAANDQCLLFPASNTGDNNDVLAVYQDASANELTLKMWDASAVGTVESAVIQAQIEGPTDLTGQMPFAATIRHSDGHILIVSLSERDAVTADHQVFDTNGTGSIVEKTAIATNIDDHYHPQICIDQATDHLYVAFNGKRDGSEDLGVATKVHTTKSTDGGTSWTPGDTAYMEDAAAAVVQVWAPLMGPRFYIGWRIGTTLMGNAVNSLDLSAVLTPVSEDNYSFPMHVTAQKRVVTVFA